MAGTEVASFSRMDVTLSWQTIALRLILTVIAGAIVGGERGEHGQTTGLRTVLLVCLAASIAMIQANLMMDTTGKAHDSFIVLDLMRLPLGILSGIGFIGAGAILRKDRLVYGVTTAATLWFVTVMGLCFGGGQIGLGLTALGLALFVLRALKRVEKLLPQDQHAILVIQIAEAAGGPTESEIRNAISSAGYLISSISFSNSTREKIREFQINVHRRAPLTQPTIPAFAEDLARRSGVLKLEWK